MKAGDKLSNLDIRCVDNEELLLSFIKNSASSLDNLTIGQVCQTNSFSRLDVSSELNITTLDLNGFCIKTFDWSAFATLINISPKLTQLQVKTINFTSTSDILQNIRLDNLKIFFWILIFFYLKLEL